MRSPSWCGHPLVTPCGCSWSKPLKCAVGGPRRRRCPRWAQAPDSPMATPGNNRPPGQGSPSMVPDRRWRRAIPPDSSCTRIRWWSRATTRSLRCWPPPIRWPCGLVRPPNPVTRNGWRCPQAHGRCVCGSLPMAPCGSAIRHVARRRVGPCGLPCRRCCPRAPCEWATCGCVTWSFPHHRSVATGLTASSARGSASIRSLRAGATPGSPYAVSCIGMAPRASCP